MNRKVAIASALVIVALAGGYLVLKRVHKGPSVMTTLRVTVTPGDRLDYVASQARSAVFNYMISKDSGVPPALARKLEVKTLPDSALLEAKVRLTTTDDGQRFAKAFVATLQDLCGKQVQLTLAEQAVK